MASLPPPCTRFEPDLPVQILSVLYDAGGQKVYVTFDRAIDAAALGDTFIHDDDNETTTSAFFNQTDPTHAVWDGPGFPTFQAGHTWSCEDRTAQGVGFPQTGVIGEIFPP